MKTFVLIALFFVVPFLSGAQELPPEDPINIDVPLGSWVLVLVGTGALYGVYKMWNSNNQTIK
ncbi:MAG TPA: hypothetical protein VM884_01005 [Flavisolibacter sp.]|nr:hypothetical protein [Flavisolibacter sp.]